MGWDGWSGTGWMEWDGMDEVGRDGWDGTDGVGRDEWDGMAQDVMRYEDMEWNGVAGNNME